MHFIFMKKTSILKERIERTMGKEIMVAIKNKRSNASMAISKAVIDEYQPSNAEEIQDALKDILGQCLKQCYSVKWTPNLVMPKWP